MKNIILKPEVAKQAKFLQCTLISADLLKSKKESKNNFQNRQSKQVEIFFAELPYPTENISNHKYLKI
ncbi:MAG: hypothetical protein GZ091_14820 [Paludibacter sp.]|nr:hypothetical protein [Paludibacter sp.]